MKRLSTKTFELVQELYADQSFWEKLIGRPGPSLGIFDEIATSSEALAIPYLAVFLLNGSSEVRIAAARAIGRLVAGVASPDLMRLDEVCRNNWNYESTASSAWRRLKPAAVEQFWQLPNATAMLGVACCHGNGFVRDAAVNQLANASDGSELPFLLVRVNDWVGKVRESAATAILHRIRPDYAEHFFRHLRLVFRLRSCGRGPHEQIVSAVLGLLCEPGSARFLREGILSNDRWLRRESFRLAAITKSSENIALLKELLVDADPILRHWAARDLLARLDDAELRPMLSTLVHNQVMPVRYEALKLLAQRFPGDAPAAYHDALLDGHASIRALARYWIAARAPEFDFAEVYRESLNAPSTKRQRAAILGLGETGKPADTEVVLRFLEAPLVSLRKSAIRTLAALDGNRYLKHFIMALSDSHPGISNEATQALLPRTHSAIDQLLLLFRNESCGHVRKNLFRLLRSQHFWALGLFLFEALRDRDESIIELGQQALRDWLRRSRNMAMAPNDQELQQLRAALKASAGMLAPRDVQEFEFLLRTHP